MTVYEWMTLDGVVQAPGAPDEDLHGGFEHGGWHLQYFDDSSRAWVVDTLSNAGGFILGRRTYEILAAYWPHASDEEQILAQPLNSKPKYVASTTLEEPLAWQNSTLLSTDVPSAIAMLKEQSGPDLFVIGSAGLVETLSAHDLVDSYMLMIDPLILGGGKGIFPLDGRRRSLNLIDFQTTETGAILATYSTTG